MSEPQTIPDRQPTEEQITTAHKIEKLLEETEKAPRQQIQRAVMVFGTDNALQMAKTAVKSYGKLWVRDHSRLKTKGGIFFGLVQLMHTTKVISKQTFKWLRAPYYTALRKQKQAQNAGVKDDVIEIN